MALSKPTNGSNADYANRIGLLFDAVNNGNYPFPATQVPSADPNTLDDYEEGTITPSDGSGAGLVLTSVAGSYVKIGRQVEIWLKATYPVTANGSNAVLGGLPFACSTDDVSRGGLHRGATSESTFVGALMVAGGTTLDLRSATGANITNATMSTDFLFMGGTYYV